MINRHFGRDLHLVVPDLESIPVPRTRSVIELAIRTDEAREAAMRERNEAHEVRRDVENNVARMHADLLAADPLAELPDPLGEIEAAQRDLDAKQTRLNGLELATRERTYEIRDAMVAEARAWAKKATADASTALLDLSNAHDALVGARERLYSTLGAGAMLLRLIEDPSAPLVPVHRAHGWVFDVEPAVESTYAALRNATEELDALRARLKRATGKTAAEPAEPVSAAPDVAAAPSEPIAAPVAPVTVAVDPDGDPYVIEDLGDDEPDDEDDDDD